MLARMRERAIWLALGLVLGGGALAFAGVEMATDDDDATETVTVVEEETESVDEVTLESETEAGEAAANHGSFVSDAAHCEAVSDSGATFTPPADCETNGRAHGRYVSEVARSGAGKGAPGEEAAQHGNESENAAEHGATRGKSAEHRPAG